MWSYFTNVTDGQTDRQTDGRARCDIKTALCTIVHRAVKTSRTGITRYAQRPQTFADLEDPDFGLWTPGSEA